MDTSKVTITLPVEDYNSLVDAARKGDEARRELAQAIVDAIGRGRTDARDIMHSLELIASGATDKLTLRAHIFDLGPVKP